MDIEPERALALVKRPHWGRHLCRHERNARFCDTSGAYYYMDSQGKYRVLQGLLPRLRAAYWPHSTYYQMLKSARQQRSVDEKKRAPRGKAKASPAPPAPKGGGRFGGVIRGTQVHRELHDFVRYDNRHFRKTHRRLHAYSSRLLHAIVDRLKLQPFLPEFGVYDETLGIGTCVDMICLDEEGHLCLLEFKTGYGNDTFTHADGLMTRSLSRMPCTVQNQATLQVTTAAVILHRRYGIPLEEMRLLVMRVDEQALEIVPVLERFVQKLTPVIYQDLLDCNSSSSAGAQ